MTELTAAAATQAKQVPDRANQDAILAQVHTSPEGVCYGLFLVADGVGGHHEGSQASRIAGETIADLTEPLWPDLSDPLSPEQQSALEVGLYEAIMTAHENILAYGEAHDIRTASTVTCALVYGRTAIIGNVGDSRTYLFRQNNLEQITEDHSLVMWLVKQGHITADESRNHPYGNVLMHALGGPETPLIDITNLPLQPGDRLLLCSDGIWDMLTDAQLADFLQTAVSPETAVNEIMASVQPIHKDDHSVIIVQI
ncbi:MAG: serine/threonine-protein phosphatase [Chloroflexi bacterium]|nr:serine/threonine-protein phosphatase [Chloroflexota bacterium]